MKSNVRIALVSGASCCASMMLASPSYAEQVSTEQPATKSHATGQPVDAQTAAAQPAGNQSSTGLQEIVVTGRKRSENLQNVPVTINTISSQAMSQVGIRRIEDIQLKVSNLVLARSQAFNINAIIRGIGSNRNVNGVGFFFDDVQDFNAYAQRLFDIDHVEVLKGPQGTLYGGLNIGGAIKYVMKRPQMNEFGGNGELILGDYGRISEEAGITGPLSHNIAIRVSGYNEKNGGILFNLLNNKKIGERHEYGGRVALLGQFGDLTTYFTLRASDYFTRRQQLLVALADPNSYGIDIFAQEDPFLRVISVTGTLQLDYDLGGGYRVTSLTGYNHADTDSVSVSASNPAPAGSNLPYLPLIRPVIPFRDRSWQQEVRLASPVDRRFNWLIGASYLDRTLGQPNRLTQRENTSFQIISTTVQKNTYEVKQYAAFGTAYYALTDKLKASVGARLNHSDITFTDLLATQNILVNGVLTPIPANTPIIVKGTDVLPRAELSYKATPDIMLYASVSTGVNPGGPSIPTSASAQPFKAEHTLAYELGFKSELFDRRLRFNAAAFFTNYRARTFTSAIQTACCGSVQTNNNIGNSRNIGFEADASFEPIHELVLSAGVGYVSSKWHGPTPVSMRNFLVPGTFTTGDIEGKFSPATPDWTANAAVEWAHPLTQDVKLRLRADIAYIGRRYWDLFNTYSSDPYTLVNLGGGFDYRNFSILAQIRNVTDTKYLLEWLPRRDSGAPVNLANPGDPRMFMVTASARF